MSEASESLLAVPADRTESELELVRVWSKIEPFATTGQQATGGWPSAGRPASVYGLPSQRLGVPSWRHPRQSEVIQAIELFGSLFEEELAQVRQARNAVVHNTELTDANLTNALIAARQLWRILSQRLESLGVAIN